MSIASLALCAPEIHSQQPRQSSAPTSFVVLSYMKAAPGKGEEYVRLEREVWKPVHQDRVNNGVIDRWRLFRLVLPGGRDYPYDFATVNAVSSLSSWLDSYSDDLFRRVHPITPLAEIGR